MHNHAGWVGPVDTPWPGLVGLRHPGGPLNWTRSEPPSVGPNGALSQT